MTTLSETFNAARIIAKKRDGETLDEHEIKDFIKGVTSGIVPDYQLTALLMAIYLKGLDVKETAALTEAMLQSGKILDFQDKTVIDKHSTGGIGDKATFVLAPIAAAAGVKVPSIAGRGLGFTGGTVDKIEAVSGFKTDIGLDRFQELLIENGLVLIGQTGDFAPADKTIYALRDVTGTVESIPLITASIMSKKLAEGISGIVLDVKCGEGAFMKAKSKARALAKSLMDTAARFKKSSMAFISDMNQPLGWAVGNSLEMIESVETLKGNGPADLTKLSLELAAGMIFLAGKATSLETARKKAQAVLDSGEALEKFKLMIESQGGDSAFIDDYTKVPVATEKLEVLAPKSAFIKGMANEEIGHLCTALGGGRKVKSDSIDFGVGFIFHVKIGDKVKKGEPLLTIYHNKDQQDLAQSIAKKFQQEVIRFSTTKVPKAKLIHEILVKKCR